MAIRRPPQGRMDREQSIHVNAYGRVNGAPADQPRLLALQWERRRRFALEHPAWTIVGEFSDVATRRSAGKLPKLRKAVAESVAGGCDVFVVDSLDRVSRLTCEFAGVVEELGRAGVTLWSATEPFTGATPSGRFAIQVLVTVAEYERLRSRRERAGCAKRRRG
jgi:DNA invertase Pin-like site-specific DNA recombinase